MVGQKGRKGAQVRRDPLPDTGQRPPAVSVNTRERSGKAESAILEQNLSGAAVLLTVEVGGSYAEVMRRTDSAVNLKEVGLRLPGKTGGQ